MDDRINIRASKYKASDIKDRLNRINVLKNIDLLGQFDFQNLLITLDSIDSNDIKNLTQIKNYDNSRKIIPLIYHEYTHFIDSTSTIWGLNHLELMQNAYSIDFKTHGQEKNFFHGKIFHDYLKRIKLPSYYTELGPSLHQDEEWIRYNSIGLIFGINGKSSDYPVIFTNFIDSNRELIARSPFSDLSLLECSATFQEFNCINFLIEKQDKDFQTIEKAEIQRNLRSLLFNRKLTEYSVCTHLVLEKFFKQDLFMALKIANAISRFCLNCPSKVFDLILRSNMLDVVLGEFDIDTKRRFRSALRKNNRGVLFYLLVKSMPEINGFKEQDAIEAFNLGKRIIGIPDDWMKYAVDEALNTLKRIETGNINLIKLVASCGFLNFKSTLNNYVEIDFFDLNLPACYLQDLNQFHPFFHEKNKLKEIDCDYFFDTLGPHESSVFKFVEACAV